MKSLLLGALATALAATSALAAPTTVSVSAQSGPWQISSNPLLDYGTHDDLAPTVVSVTAGEMLTLTYVGGFVSAFAGVPPSYIEADGYSVAAGYPTDYYGSGPGRTGAGSSGDYFPSHVIDPLNVGPNYINLLEVLGDFATSSGVVVGAPFAIGDGPYSITAPAGATQLQLGFNDDIFSDNSGSVSVEIAGLTSAAPEPFTWALMLMAITSAGLALRRFRGERASRGAAKA